MRLEARADFEALARAYGKESAGHKGPAQPASSLGQVVRNGDIDRRVAETGVLESEARSVGCLSEYLAFPAGPDFYGLECT